MSYHILISFQTSSLTTTDFSSLFVHRVLTRVDENELSSTTSTTRSINGIGHKQGASVGKPANLTLDDWTTPETLYQIEFSDTGGDGICCDYGHGWITLTDKNKNVIWSSDGTYGFVEVVYLWLNDLGEYSVVASSNNSNGQALTAPPAAPTSNANSPPVSQPSLRPTGRPTSRPVPSTTSSSSACPLCVGGGSVAYPDKIHTFEETDTSESFSLSCAEIEEVFDLFLPDECYDRSNSSYQDNLAYYCGCPQSSCGLCTGNDSVGAPSKTFDLGDGDEPISCSTLEFVAGLFDEEECLDMTSSTDFFRAYCECPGVEL